jgi:hypothetical protein
MMDNAKSVIKHVQHAVDSQITAQRVKQDSNLIKVLARVSKRQLLHQEAEVKLIKKLYAQIPKPTTKLLRNVEFVHKDVSPAVVHKFALNVGLDTIFIQILKIDLSVSIFVAQKAIRRMTNLELASLAAPIAKCVFLRTLAGPVRMGGTSQERDAFNNALKVST